MLVTTSVLQAGHSLDCHFTISFDFLFLGVLTFREELQFVSRLRYLSKLSEEKLTLLDRNNMAQYKYAWIQNGKCNSKLASTVCPPSPSIR